MRHTLRGVNEYLGADGMGGGGNSLNRVNRAQDVGNMRNRYQLCAFRQYLIEIVQLEQSPIGHLNESERRAGSFREQLPRQEVAVVLHHGEEDFIAATDIGAPPAIRDKID